MIRSLLSAALLALPLAACTTDDVIGPDKLPRQGSFTVDARNAWVYVSLTDSAVVTPTPSPSESSAWDIAFFSTNVTLNGGAAGPGGVTGACICQNAAATNTEILAMTPSSELPDFESVTSVPVGLTFTSDGLTPAIAGWFTGSGATAVADTAKHWLMRLSDSTAYALVRVKSIASPTATTAGTVTIEYRFQATAAGTLSAPNTIAVNLATGAKRVDLKAGVVTTDAAAWDIVLDGFTIRVNGGITGSGKAAAAVGTGEFSTVTTAVTMANAYRQDTYAGIFGTNRYWRYNLAGDFRISPTFDVYLIKRGTRTYKLQVINYYNETGLARFITFRWARLD
jgi:hypothetical protein